jgi:small subunit ribosomal protein S4
VAKYRGPVCRLCRREGEKLFLKGSRCMTEKCAIERRSYPPGQHGQARPRISDYSTQLREKQKLRRIYGLQERQFRGVFERAERQSGVTGEALLRLLECRLDNVAYRLGFGASRKEARQLVGHGHVTVNGRKNNIPGAQVRAGDVVAVRERSRSLTSIQTSLESVEAGAFPNGWNWIRPASRGPCVPCRRRTRSLCQSTSRWSWSYIRDKATSCNAGFMQNASQNARLLPG